MGKAAGSVLKGLAIVAGVALAIPTGGTSLLAVSLGVSGLAAAGIAAGLALGSSLLSPKPKAPQASGATADRLFTSIDPRAPRKIVFGTTAMATDIRDQEFTGDQEYLHRFVVVASHKVAAIEEIWFDDKRVWTAAGGVEGDVVGYLTVTPILEGSAANAINISPRMGSTRRYTGCAYVHFRFKLTGNSKKSESPFAQSVPTRVTVRGKGALIYDPRLDSTVGGSGPQRANDQSTWAWSDSASRNPALQELWYELGWRINGKLAVGKGVPPERLDIASYITAANLCDEAVALAAGGTEPRYRSDGVFSEGDAPSLVRDNLKAAMNAVLDDMDGKIRLTVISNDLATPIADFTEADVIDGVRWDQTPPIADTFNVIRGSYTDPSDQSLYQMVDYPEIALPSIDGIERIETIDFPLVQSASQAQRLAKQRLQRMQYPGLFTANFQATAWRVQKGDVVRLTFPALGWLNKLFRVIDITVRVDGVVPMVLREEHASIYAWSASEAPAVTNAAPTTYDWTKNPLYADIAALNDVSSAYNIILTNDGEQLPATHEGVITSYAAATTGVRVFYGGDDVTAQFAPVALMPGDGRNPQGLSISGTYPEFAVTDGFDASEENASFLFRVAGTGAHAGVTLDKQFSLSKSKAALDGTPPPLMRVTSSHQTFRFDGEDVPYTQGTLVSASRSNATGSTAWRVYKPNGTLLLDGSAAAIVAGGAASSSPDNDRLVISQSAFKLFLDANGITGAIYEAAMPGAFDRITIIKVKDGTNGAPGLNNATVQLYKRASSTPAVPSVTTTYTFAGGSLAGADNGWTQTISAGTDPLYTTIAVASAATATDTIATGEWAAPVVQSANGVNAKSLFIYQRAASAPSLPSVNATYTFSTQVLAGLNNGWQTTIPDGTNPLWVSTAGALSPTDVDNINPGEWAAARKLAENGTDGVSPISVSALPEGLQVSLNADGSPAGGALPQAIGVSATKAGAASTITSITIVSNPGNTASVSGSQINVTAVSGDGEVVFDVVSAGQTVRKRVAVTTTRAGSNGSLQQVLATNTPQLTWSAYQQHGGSIAINASAAGKLKLNLTGLMRVAVGGDDLRFQSKLQYREAAGTWTDVSGSEAVSTKSETVFDPTRVLAANVNGAGPYTLTGLTANGAYEVRALTRKYDGTATTTATVALSMSAEQVA